MQPFVFTIRFLYNFAIIKPTRCTSFPNLLRHEILHVSGSFSAHHQEFIYCTLGTGICHTCLYTAFEQDQVGTEVPSWSLSKTIFKLVCHIPVPSVQWINSWWWAEELSETCRVSCLSKFGKLIHLVGFIKKKLVTMCGHMNVKFIVRVSRKTRYQTNWMLLAIEKWLTFITEPPSVDSPLLQSDFKVAGYMLEFTTSKASYTCNTCTLQVMKF